LLATADDIADLEQQNEIDREYLESFEDLDIVEDSNEVSFEQCLSLKYSEDELKE
jgi:hypothetical protein